MLEQLEKLQRKANANWGDLKDSQKCELMNLVFRIAIDKEKATEETLDLMFDLYDRLKKESTK